VNFAAVAYLLAWTLIAGREAAKPWVRRIAEGLHRLLRLPFLRLLGRHSIQVYSLHVFLIYGVHLIDAQTDPWTEGFKTMVLVAAIAALAVPALCREGVLSLARRPHAMQDG
jgi:hypothetical protein